MRPKFDPTQDDEAPDHLASRHSDVVPRIVGAHLSWPETPSLRLPDERREAWMSAYESSFDAVFDHCDRGDWLVPLVYAAGHNDVRLSRALLRFAHEVSLLLEAPDEALAMLEVAESMVMGELGKDLCIRIADNLIEESYERFMADRRFERYFYCHCAAAVARLASRVHDAASARDAVDAIHSGVSALRAAGHEDDSTTLRLAARLIREEITQPPRAPEVRVAGHS
jgi:hypothetical protein